MIEPNQSLGVGGGSGGGGVFVGLDVVGTGVYVGDGVSAFGGDVGLCVGDGPGVGNPEIHMLRSTSHGATSSGYSIR